jgi:hypothetical protein
MHRSGITLLLGLTITTTLSGVAMAQGRTARRQSKVRPFGLEIVDTVRIGGSDSRSKDFNNNYLSKLSNLNGAAMAKSLTHGNSTSVLVDPSKIQLQHDYDSRAYFIGDYAGYHNTLGFNTSGGGVTTGNPKLIFPDASESSRRRTTSEPLRSGDFVNLGTTKAGTKLDFFLIADGARGGSNVFSTDDSINPDGVRHVMSHAQVFTGSPYLMLAFEDIYGGGDFNDLIIAIDIGEENVDKLVKTIGAPEPGAFASLITFLGVAVVCRRRIKGDYS